LTQPLFSLEYCWKKFTVPPNTPELIIVIIKQVMIEGLTKSVGIK
jgi:hypothetical protein